MYTRSFRHSSKKTHRGPRVALPHGRHGRRKQPALPLPPSSLCRLAAARAAARTAAAGLRRLRLPLPSAVGGCARQRRPPRSGPPRPDLVGRPPAEGRPKVVAAVGGGGGGD
uniref:Uncharacterized protein n=1 Tax=Oryza sativa subsp. japonica TaxID=39947 RepID=Q5VN74_ORYSJ|nr:hypothetical protein [Oryza sativa Japonica Group]